MSRFWKNIFHLKVIYRDYNNFAIVKFANREDGAYALQQLNGLRYESTVLEVEYQKNKKN